MAISALGRAGKWKEAVQVLDGMGKGGDGGDRPDNFAYGAAINACGKAGRPVEVSKALIGLEGAQGFSHRHKPSSKRRLLHDGAVVGADC